MTMGRKPTSTTSCWQDPDPQNEAWNKLSRWRKAACLSGFHHWHSDGYGHNGGWHCIYCRVNK